jgi:hypothetical protein
LFSCSLPLPSAKKLFQDGRKTGNATLRLLHACPKHQEDFRTSREEKIAGFI